ncbi:beta-glucosidase BglX [Allomuricauda sp. SCSIO 65647]|uniref:beta-glucosidase BglX n=1 Tax=Allomuricauda sp. SCSIO 65647 TaxID=2908843 RepID=UPI001F167FE8|nr:beta-glucosidase BglX [Muricauda sp. SCSIO 65647]UJH66838.1 beta-glucosidase BglX [Muricauda sp. SCSIO 65647]
MGQQNFEKQIDSLLNLMTLEEKVGQMNLYSGFYDATGPAPKGGNAVEKYEHLKKGWVGAMLNVRGAEQTKKLQEIVVNETRLGIPLLFGLDVVHGQKTLAPIPLAEAASWDLQAIENSAKIAADEAAAEGVHWTFAPMVDISRDARWGRVMEGAGEDTYLGSKIAIARVKGFQGEDLSAPNTIAACAKHFAAYGFAEAGRDYNTVDVGTYTLYNMVLPPFKAATGAGVKTFMNAFNILNGVPATGDAMLQREILKGKWNFDGFVVSDWGSVAEMIAHGHAKDSTHAAELAANAGSDMDMASGSYLKNLTGLVKEGKVDESKIDDAVRRILRVKFELGLFEDPYRYSDIDREKERIYHPDHQAGVLEMAKKSIVLLKNDGNVLPLDKDQKGIVVIGDLADDKNSPLGSWRLASDDDSAVSFLEGMDAYTKEYTFVQGPTAFYSASFLQHVKVNETDTSGIQEAVEAAKSAEVVIMVLGEHGFMSGESRSRTTIDIPVVQKKLLKAVYEVNKNIVLVLMNGRPLTITWEAENIPAILETWQLGSQTGNAIAQVLFGDYNPSGKLPMTFPRSVGQVPIYYNHYSTGRPVNKEGNVFWSHYADEENSPLYPFGHGLSYTSFQYSDLQVDATDPKNVKVSVSVTNTGNRAGEEVVQLYLQDPYASIVRPVKELKGFEKIMLEAGTSKTVSFNLTDKELGFYNQQYEWVVEPGSFNVMVGTNSQEGLSGSFVVDQ